MSDSATPEYPQSLAFSNNEFRWSSRIKREDGLIRMVPGLGTRAVDRTSDDYPILIAPGKPNLSVNVSIEESIRYSPKFVDVMNLKTRKFETVELSDLLIKYGSSYPGINKVVSILKEGHIEEPRALGTDYSKEKFIVTFNGLTGNTKFIKQMHAILNILEEKYNHSIDIESFGANISTRFKAYCEEIGHNECMYPSTLYQRYQTSQSYV